MRQERGSLDLRRKLLRICALLLLAFAPALAQWQAIGPFGGNARALAADPLEPSHILLGSGAGALFESRDGGRHWSYRAHLGQGDNLMLEILAFDPEIPATIYAGGWNVSGEGGGFFISHDGGSSWSEPEGLRGKSIQALAQSVSDPHILIAGALDGLYRSRDRGGSWQRITPAGHADLRNFESVAIDPRNPNVIYAGTWHLPWKTINGGASWEIIKHGMIEDSDVFSIILDRSRPETIYASACSGIYKSDNAGVLFRKIQGIPHTAQRTRVMEQDPASPQTVYAGTTEGLYKTTDGGASFRRITPANFILNDIQIDPRNPKRLLIATDRGGVFSSDDGGESFQPSNDGFAHRQIATLAAVPGDAVGIYAGVLNDKEFGGVFQLREGQWSQANRGLEGADIFDLELSAKGRLVAATNLGIFVFDPAGRSWKAGQIKLPVVTPPKSAKARRGAAHKVAGAQVHSPVVMRAWALALSEQRWYSATDAGVLYSDDEGLSWSRSLFDQQSSVAMVASAPAAGAAQAAYPALANAASTPVSCASRWRLWYSSNGGGSWSRMTIPDKSGRINAIAMSASGDLWVAARQGLLHWRRRKGDDGDWEPVAGGLPAGAEVSSIQANAGVLSAIVGISGRLYQSRDDGRSWTAAAEPPFAASTVLLRDGAVYLGTRQHGVFKLAGGQ
jgi:photosystem II stability/assembly factor-like uncharacterized protein